MEGEVMIIIEKDAEKKLLEELSLIKEEPDYRIIRYSFSELDDDLRGKVQDNLTAKIIAEILDNPYAKAFVCQDKDVFITGPGIYARAYAKLTLEMNERCDKVNLQEYSHIYDITENWAVVFNNVKSKHDSITTKEQLELEKMRKEQECQYTSNILAGGNLESELIETISQRRERRTGSNILIVEDDAFSRKLIRNVLNKEYHVIDVEDGKDAVTSYITTSPDVVFLDIDLPDVNGHEILQAILKLDKSAYIIMLSGNSDQDNVVKAIQAGAKGFVAKPFLKERLYKYISECPAIIAKQENASSGA